LLLLRTDKESGRETTMVDGLPPGWKQADWLDDDPQMHKRVLLDTRVSAVMSLNMRKLSKMSRRKYYYEEVSKERMERGTKLLSRARFIITDRLHVHIVSTLMGIPHCFMDNTYGKISRFSTAFDTRWTDSYHARSLADAMDCARHWLVNESIAS
jgi:exopolysaccharide biosynthesis predicted pyruvyltransferase EpsI